MFSFLTELLDLNAKRVQTPFAFLLGKNFHKYELRAVDKEVSKRAKMVVAYSQDLIDQLIKNNREKKGDKNGGIIDIAIKKNLVAFGDDP